MSDIFLVGPLLQDARTSAGLSQTTVALACGTSQSAIARLENGESNATIATLVRCAAAIGYAIEIDLVPLPTTDPVIERFKEDVDRASLRDNLQRTVEQRLRSLGEWQQSLAALRLATQAPRAKRE
jgi:transcriptional regulator with XRE-family HTH domain